MNKKPELLPSCRLNLPGGKKRILLVLLVMMLSVVNKLRPKCQCQRAGY